MNPRVLCFIAASAFLCQAEAQDATPPAPAAAPIVTPASPSALFEELSLKTKPLWRQQYRGHIERTVVSRPKAALALGALMTDLSLATAARDAQQLRNLEQDEVALEKLLGIVDKMAAYRQRFLMTAESGDWANVSKHLVKAHERQVDLLTALRDQDLATLVTTGQWLRAWQISTNVVADKKLANESLSLGSEDLARQVFGSVSRLAETAPPNDRCMKVLAKKVGQLEKAWQQPLDPAQRPARLAQTAEILNDLILQLVQDQPAPPKTPAPAVEKTTETTLPSR